MNSECKENFNEMLKLHSPQKVYHSYFHGSSSDYEEISLVLDGISHLITKIKLEVYLHKFKLNNESLKKVIENSKDCEQLVIMNCECSIDEDLPPAPIRLT
jgi:hypothetical protein